MAGNNHDAISVRAGFGVHLGRPTDCENVVIEMTNASTRAA